MKDSIFIAGSSVKDLAEEICLEAGGEFVSDCIERFSDGEVRVEIKQPIRGRHVFIVQSFSGEVNSMIMEALLIADAAYREGAGNICLICPYMAYMRQDRKDRKGVPISAQVLAQTLSGSKIQHIITMDLHAKQNQGFFSVLLDELFAADLFVPLIKQSIKESGTVLVAPDVGAIKNTRQYSELLGIPYAFIEKIRHDHKTVEAKEVYGEVSGMDTIIVDDICSTGSTLLESAKILKDKGATKVSAYITHGLFSDKTIENIDQNGYIDELFCTNSINNDAILGRSTKIKTISIGKFLGNSTKKLYEHGRVDSDFA